MARRIIKTGFITNEQIAAIYQRAAELGVSIAPWQNHLGPNRSWFQWAVDGGIFRSAKMVRYLKTFR